MQFKPTLAAWCVIATGGLAMPASALAQLRVVNWNVTAYTSGRVADFQNAFYGIVPPGLALAGQRMSPDIIIAEEVVGTTGSPTGAINFLNLLNGAAGSPGDWARADYVETTVGNGGTNSAHSLFYRTSKVDLLTQTPFSGVSTQFTKVLSSGTGSCATCPPRDNHRWRVRLKGYTAAGAEVYLYAAHMKAGDTGADQTRRTPEADRIRGDSNALPGGANFLLGGDFNIQSSGQTAYGNLLSSGANPAGRFFDPINTSGSWNNSSTYRFVHTQDPVGGGGMDDRHDIILISPTLRDNAGIEYLGSTAAYSTAAWNDPNHSYRSWGNDGTSFNLALTTTGNSMVGAAIAQSLINSAGTGGHLPVFLDLSIPAEITTNVVNINFGTVNQNDVAQQTLTVANGINTVVFDRGGPATIGGKERLQTLSYTLAASAGFTAPGGTFTRAAAAAANSHSIVMNTSTPGLKTGTVTIASNSLDAPSLVINLTGNVVVPAPTSCNPADIAGPGATYGNGTVDVGPDGALSVEDFSIFLAAFSDASGCPGTSPCNPADITGSGSTYSNGTVDVGPDGDLSIEDFLIFVAAFSDGAGCE